MRNLTRKGEARIYCEFAKDILAIEEIIREIDAFEFEYLPYGMIAEHTEYPKTVFTGKFDGMDMNTLTAECWKRGIRIWVYDAGKKE